MSADKMNAPVKAINRSQPLKAHLAKMRLIFKEPEIAPFGSGIMPCHGLGVKAKLANRC